MKDKIESILKFWYGASSPKATEELLSLLAESTVDVSASEGESDVLHGVVECNAERSSTTEINKEDVEGTLEKIIDCENFFCKNRYNTFTRSVRTKCKEQCRFCKK